MIRIEQGLEILSLEKMLLKNQRFHWQVAMNKIYLNTFHRCYLEKEIIW